MRSDKPTTGTRFCWGVELETLLIELAVQVDRETRHAQEGPFEIDELAAEFSSVAHDDTAGERQIAVEPGVEQHAAIGLDRELGVAVAVHVGDRLQAQIRRIGVGPDDSEARFRRRPAPDLEGREAPAGAHDITSIARRNGPDVRFFESRKTGLFESQGDGRDRVIGRGRSIDELEEVRDQVLHDAGA